MNAILLESISREELKSLISDAVKNELSIQPKGKEQNDLLTRKEVRELLKISFPTLHEFTKTGKIKAYRLGGRVFYKKQEIVDSLTEVQALKYKRG